MDHELKSYQANDRYDWHIEISQDESREQHMEPGVVESAKVPVIALVLKHVWRLQDKVGCKVLKDEKGKGYDQESHSILVGSEGLEPPTSWMSTRRSDQLS
jgi:hypothetical protein